MPIDVLLLFPPTTEARLFPYLSLPMLTAYLRNKEITVYQEDLNIWLSSKLVSCEWFNSTHTQIIANSSMNNSLKDKYRANLLDFFKIYGDELNKVAFAKQPSCIFQKDEAIRLSKNAIDLALEKSVLKTIIPSLNNLVQTVCNQKEAENNYDLPLLLLKEKVEALIFTHSPRVVGISISFFSQLLPSLLIAKWVKQQHNHTMVILGGQQIMLRYKELYPLLAHKDFVDGLCIDAGEECLEKAIDFLDGRSSPDNIPNFLFIKETDSLPIDIKKGTLKINDLPVPDFTGLPFDSYLNREVQIPLITCVGCYWGRCVFCSYGNRSYLNNSYQQQTPEKIADNCESLIQKYGISRINFVDENNNLTLILKGVRILNDRGYKISFSTRNRLEKKLKDLSFCQELADRGCVLMSVGYETNVQRLLDKMDKGVNASYYQEIVDNLHAVKIALRFSIMGGLFDETEEEFNESLRFLETNASKIGIDVMQMLVLEPETILSKDPDTFGLQNLLTDSLRGNKVLNYLHGRMGYSFDYRDQQPYDQKLERFIRIFHKVQPGKNLVTSPHMQPSNIKRDSYNRLNLHPWVVCLSARSEDGGGSVLADLQYETLYKLPSALDYVPKEQCLVPKSFNENSENVIFMLAQRGLGNPSLHI